MFAHVEPFAGDPILSLNEDFQKDPRPHKINLSIGIYFDDAGRIPVLESVQRAEAQLLAEGGAKPYLPIEGAANFRAAVQADAERPVFNVRPFLRHRVRAERDRRHVRGRQPPHGLVRGRIVGVVDEVVGLCLVHEHAALRGDVLVKTVVVPV